MDARTEAYRDKIRAAVAANAPTALPARIEISPFHFVVAFYNAVAEGRTVQATLAEFGIPAEYAAHLPGRPIPGRPASDPSATFEIETNGRNLRVTVEYAD